MHGCQGGTLPLKLGAFWSYRQEVLYVAIFDCCDYDVYDWYSMAECPFGV